MKRELMSLSYRHISIWIQVLILIKNRAILVINVLGFFCISLYVFSCNGILCTYLLLDFLCVKIELITHFFAKDI